MKTLSYDDYVKQMFASNPSVKTLFVTSDRQGFTTEVKAEAHSGSLKDKKVKKHERGDFLEEPKPEPKVELIDLSIAKLTEAIAEENDIEKLEGLVVLEAAKDEPRKGALEAIEARLKAIAEAQEVQE